MAEDEEAAATVPLQKRVLSRSHGSRAIPGRPQDLPPVPSKVVRDTEPPSGDRHFAKIVRHMLIYGRFVPIIAGTAIIAEMDLMLEKFAKLLLGEDMSGTGKGVSSALALSNAITNLAGKNTLLTKFVIL